ncbi:MAG: response regulator [Nitrospirae bacterium]|nr:response regulator [Nitrospirota bacterium]
MSGEKVLVVDDVEIVFSAFKEELGEFGYEVDTALSGEMAVEKARAKKYDVIFIDMVMPGMDGIQTCRALKQITPDSKLIAMTGQIYSGLANKELEFVKAGGKVFYLYKPFQTGEILEATVKALSERS